VVQLSTDVRLDIIQQRWDSLGDDVRDSLVLAADQEEELDRPGCAGRGRASGYFGGRYAQSDS
jgi:hypothetical protein